MKHGNNNELRHNNPKIDWVTIVFLGTIILMGLIIRLIFFPFEIPLILDNLAYFWYGLDMSITGSFPTNYDLANNTWPSLLSVFFSLFPSENFLDYMNLQRMISSIISVLTVIPMYFLCKHFFSKNVAIIGTAIFVFEPRIINNSILGITEPLFLILGITTIWLFLNSNTKIVLASFVLAGLFSLVRYEGLLIIIPMTILFFVRYRRQKKIIPKYMLALVLFVIVLLPMASVRISTMGYDGLLSHVKDGAIVATTQNALNENPERQKFFPALGLLNFVKFVGWILIPNFIIFLPFGLFLLLKNRNWKANYVILISIFLLIPAFYAYSRGISDTRYLFIVYPILTIISLYSIDWITKKFDQKSWILFIIVIGLGLTSWVFLDMKIDNEHEMEAFEIALKNSPQLSAINAYYPESTYYKVTVLAELEEFPTLKENVDRKISVIPTNNVNTLEEFLLMNKENGLKHIVVDDMPERPEFLKQVFSKEENFPYLKKVYDSKTDGYEYHVKIFEINYDDFITQGTVTD